MVALGARSLVALLLKCQRFRLLYCLQLRGYSSVTARRIKSVAPSAVSPLNDPTPEFLLRQDHGFLRLHLNAVVVVVALITITSQVMLTCSKACAEIPL